MSGHEISTDHMLSKDRATPVAETVKRVPVVIKNLVGVGEIARILSVTIDRDTSR